MARSAAPQERLPLDPHVWRRCAGTAAHIPPVGTRVYYFPQGHAEQATTPPDFSAVPRPKPYYLCRISGITYQANLDTDEVFASVSLEPGGASPDPPPSSVEDPEPDPDDGADVVGFAKILTPSDANNGGGFSVPRFCADSIFPPLDFNADPPVQTLLLRDVHGATWQFRHIYRGTPRRHLLTTGWSKFVNSKRLVAGDSVVFVRDRAGELFVGVRRTGRFCSTPIASDYLKGVKLEETMGSRDGFSRNVRGRVPPDTVVEAVRLAEKDQPFQVMYYPRAGSPEFVVAADKVEAMMHVYWSPGMRVKMSVETEDSSRTTWFQGTVSAAAVQDSGLWAHSPWRMLQVTWDEPEVLQNVKNVNPWQVELVLATPHIQHPYPAMKKLRVAQNPEIVADRDGQVFIPLTGMNSAMIGSLTPSLFNYNTFPAGMQGARHDQMCLPNISNFIPTNSYRVCSNNIYGGNLPPKLPDVSTELNIGSTSLSESSSPQSQGSIHYLSPEHFGSAAGNQTRKPSGTFIQLFGQVIHANEQSDPDAEMNKECKDGEATQSLDFSLPSQQKETINKFVVQCQRVQAVGGCSL